MKTYSQLILLIGTFLVFSPSLFGQDNTILLNLPESGAKEHVATEEIRLQPGYTYTANSSASMWGYIDETAGGDPVTYESLFDDNAFNMRAIDPSLSVGLTAGSSSVSSTGGASYQIPVVIPLGTGGMVPEISIDYSSQSGNGLLGSGWNLGGISAISRAGKTKYRDGEIEPIKLDNSDHFVFNGAVLIPISGANGSNATVYATEQESYVKITSFGSVGGGPEWFKVETNDGMVMEYGRGSSARFSKISGNETIAWQLNKVYDKNTNYITYHYQKDGSSIRISEIRYTGNSNKSIVPYNKVKFFYGNRSDHNKIYVAGAKIMSKYILSKIEIDVDGQIFKKYYFKYGKNQGYSFLNSVQEEGADESKLNHTIFKYLNSTPTLSEETFPITVNDKRLVSADFNGDGLDDILVLNTGLPICNSCGIVPRINLSCELLINNGSSFTSTYTHTFESNSSSAENLYQQVTTNNPIIGDFNGDQKMDFVTTVMQDFSPQKINIFLSTGTGFTKKTHNIESFINQKIDDIVLKKFYDNNLSWFNTAGGAGINAPQISWLRRSAIISPGDFITIGDFDGNGTSDIFIDVELQLSTSSLANPSIQTVEDFDTKFTAVNFDLENGDFAMVEYGNSDFKIEGDNNDINVFALEFDGDARRELAIINRGLTYVYKINNSGLQPELELLYDLGYPTIWHKYRAADFNGDGLTDFLASGNNGTNWYVGLGTGTGWSETPFIPQVSIDLTDNDQNFIVADMNGDGKSDIVHGESKQVPTNGPWQNNLYVYYSTGIDFITEQFALADRIHYLAFSIGNLKGRGDMQIIHHPSIYGSKLLSFGQNSFNSKLKKVKNGFNSEVEFSYAYQRDASTYTKSYTPSFPLGSIDKGLTLVKMLEKDDGVGGINATTYNYEDAILHKEGNGFLGFKRTTVLNDGKLTTSEQAIEESYFVMYPLSNETKLASDNSLIQESSQTIEFTPLGGTRYKSHLSSSLSIDHITGFSSDIIDIQYGPHGQPTQIEKDNGAEHSWTYTTYTNLGSTGTPMWRASSTNNEVVRNGEALHSRTVNYSYNNKGQISQEIADPGESKAVTTSFQYDQFGNAKEVTISASGLPNRVSKKVYSSRGQFVIESENVLGQKSYATYENLWGQPLTSTTISGKITSYEYDAWGRLTKTTLPNGKYSTQTRSWEIGTFSYGASSSLYLTKSTSTLGVISETWYDEFARPIRVVDEHPSGTDVVTKNNFTPKGQDFKSTEPFFLGASPSNVTTRVYDDLNQLISSSNAITTISYSYIKTTDGYKTTAQKGSNTTSRTLDGSAKVIESSDNGGNMYFTYFSSGLQKSVSNSSLTLASMEYDIFGNQTKLIDNNAGTSEYEYDAYGQLTNQIDANSNEYQILYDVIGRVVSKTNVNDPTDIISRQYVTTGNGLNQLKKESFPGTGNHSISYLYDNYGRVTQNKEHIDAQDYVTSYTYNADGKNTSITYPSGFVVNYEYDSKGLLTQVKDNSAKVIYSNSNFNQFGKLTSYEYGNGIVTNNQYDQYGVLQRITSGTVFDMEFTFDLVEGNLSQRKDVLNGLIETFSYDNLNRLVQETRASGPAVTMGYDPNGNILNKTDVGFYHYNWGGTSNHALKAINMFPSNGVARPPSPVQVLGYTDFDRTSYVEEGDYRITFSYGTDRDRKKSVLEYQNNITRTRYYVGSYEKEIEGTDTREIHYINCGSGVTAYYVIENGIGNYYYPHKDYLGSILTISDDLGVVKFEQSFDPWGRFREPTDWTTTITTTNSLSWFYRGFTGHEHLHEFTLINMNNRMYDPEVGRMLAIDNFIQSPYSTQAYNRYSYVGNNPLMYSDPSGEIVIPAIIIGIATGAAVGAGIGAGMYAATVVFSNEKWDWKTFGKSAAFGAVSGGIGAGIGALGAQLGLGQSLGYNMMTSMASQSATTLAFGGDIDLNAAGVASLMFGAAIGNGLGNFNGVKGGVFKNVVAEIGHGIFKGGLSGAYSGMLAANLTGTSVDEGIIQGMKHGAIAGGTMASMRLVAFGAAYVPDEEYGEFSARNRPVYRRGNRMFPSMTGLTLGRQLITSLSSSNKYNRTLRAHETGHYYQQSKLGWGNFYARTLGEYIKYGFNESYSTAGTLEFGAEIYSLNRIGYFYGRGGYITNLNYNDIYPQHPRVVY
jgi:RHS repeat-associated protein